MGKADEFWSEKEIVAIKDDRALGNDSRYRETVKYRAKSKILRAFNGMLKVENPRIVTDKILIKALEVVKHFLKLRGFEEEANMIDEMQESISFKILKTQQ